MDILFVFGEADVSSVALGNDHSIALVNGQIFRRALAPSTTLASTTPWDRSNGTSLFGKVARDAA